MNEPPISPAGPTPTVLRTLASAVLLDRAGDLELARETRGSTIDWGGVYGQHVRLCATWRLRIRAGGSDYSLPPTRVGSSVVGEHYVSEHRLGSLRLVQDVVPLPAPSGALRRLTLTNPTASAVPVTVTSAFVPHLLPVLVEGIRPVDFELRTRTDDLQIRHRGFALAYGSDVLATRLYVDRASWLGGRRRGPVEQVASDHEVALAPGGSSSLSFAIVGGLARELPGTVVSPDGPFARSPDAIGQSLAEEDAAWLSTTPTMRIPDAPELEAAYTAARRALRQLYSRPGEDLTGLVAGYPWYSAFWGRDLAWMLPAVLWLGDLEWARRSIATMLRFQATTDLPLLAGQSGEVPMQLSTGPVFLYGTSDTTLYYPALVERWVRHAGDAEIPSVWWTAIARCLAWGERRADPATGLFRNGGEVEEVERAIGDLVRTRYGIDAQDTTIWDSTDRRDHAIDVQVLWAASLRAAARLARAGVGPEQRAAERWDALADRVEASVRTRYLWADEGYLADSIRLGVPVRRLRPNALRVVSAGLLEPATARTVVQRARRDDLTTAWGLRTLSSRDPAYSPTSYHDGQVWTIATAWAAEAAFAVGDVPLGVDYLRTIAARFREEGGGANECYRGDRAEPFNSCFLLGFSVGPFLSVLFERLWGLSADGRRPQLTVRPAFPATWRSATLEGLRVGPGSAALRLDGRRIEVEWSGPRPLELVGPNERATIDPGTRGLVGRGPVGGSGEV